MTKKKKKEVIEEQPEEVVESKRSRAQRIVARVQSAKTMPELVEIANQLSKEDRVGLGAILASVTDRIVGSGRVTAKDEERNG